MKDAERKRKWRKHNHLQMKVDKNPVSDNYDGHNGKRKKMKVWCGNTTRDWKLATQLSKFCDVNPIGRRNQKGYLVLGAIVKFDHKDELEIMEKNKYMEEKQCLARQGDHDSAEYFNAIRLLDFGPHVRVRWLDRRVEQWLPSNQVQDLPLGPRQTRSGFEFRYKPGQTVLMAEGEGRRSAASGVT